MSLEEIVHCLAQTLQLGVAVEHPLVVLALYVVQSLGLVGQLSGSGQMCRLWQVRQGMSGIGD